jgi:MFS family permease
MITDQQREARRTAFIFASTLAIVGSAGPISFALGALAGDHLLGPDKALASAPVTGFTVGVALGALPAAAVLKRVGQRSGFMFGTLVTALGGALATLALFQSSFWLFVAALLIIGFGGAFVQQLRFAAADNAPPAFKARAISFVLAGGVVTAILGPQIVILTNDLFAPVMFAGAFASIIALAAVGAGILALLRSNPAVVADDPAQDLDARPLGEIVRQPRFAVGLVCGVSSYALMSFVMTGAPLAMVGCGFTSEQATLGISWHVMAMYAPSFFTGRLVSRYGAERIVAAGLVLLLACAAVALSGIELWQFWTSLILLGLGWNFGFIGATSMIAESYRPSEKNRAQGFHDFVLFSSVAFGSLMSGLTYNAWGWDMLNWVVFPICLVCLAALALLRARRSVTAA